MMAIRGPGGQRKSSETTEMSVLYVVAANPSATTWQCRVLASSPCYCQQWQKHCNFFAMPRGWYFRTLQQAACCSGWRYDASREILRSDRAVPHFHMPAHTCFLLSFRACAHGRQPPGPQPDVWMGHRVWRLVRLWHCKFLPFVFMCLRPRIAVCSPQCAVPHQQNSIRNDAAAQSACAARGMLAPAGTRGTSKGPVRAAAKGL